MYIHITYLQHIIYLYVCLCYVCGSFLDIQETNTSNFI